MTSQWIKKSESWLIWIIFTVSVCLRGLSMFAFCWREMGHAAVVDPYANRAAPTMWNLSLLLSPKRLTSIQPPHRGLV